MQEQQQKKMKDLRAYFGTGSGHMTAAGTACANAKDTARAEHERQDNDTMTGHEASAAATGTHTRVVDPPNALTQKQSDLSSVQNRTLTGETNESLLDLQQQQQQCCTDYACDKAAVPLSKTKGDGSDSLVSDSAHAKGKQKRPATPECDQGAQPPRRSKRLRSKAEGDVPEPSLLVTTIPDAGCTCSTELHAAVASAILDASASGSATATREPTSDSTVASPSKGEATRNSTKGKEVQEEKEVEKAKEKVQAKGSGRKPAQKKVNPEAKRRESLEKDSGFARLPKDVKDRIVRVLCQRMYLINRYRSEGRPSEDFDVYGSGGNVYKVTVGPATKCSCMDWRIRRGLCKHLIFVLLKVLSIGMSSPILLNNSLTAEQVEDLFESARPNPVDADAMAPTEVREAWEMSVGLRSASGSKDRDQAEPEGKRLLPVEGDCCPICYEDLEAGSVEGLVFCLTSCGKPLHTDCFKNWSDSKGGIASGRVTCVWCRAPWNAIEETTTGWADDELRENGHGIGMWRGAVRDGKSRRGVLNLANVVVRPTGGGSGE